MSVVRIESSNAPLGAVQKCTRTKEHIAARKRLLPRCAILHRLFLHASDSLLEYSALAVPLGIKGIQIAKTLPITAIHMESAMPAVKQPAQARTELLTDMVLLD